MHVKNIEYPIGKTGYQAGYPATSGYPAAYPNPVFRNPDIRVSGTRVQNQYPVQP